MLIHYKLILLNLQICNLAKFAFFCCKEDYDFCFVLEESLNKKLVKFSDRMTVIPSYVLFRGLREIFRLNIFVNVMPITESVNRYVISSSKYRVSKV